MANRTFHFATPLSAALLVSMGLGGRATGQKSLDDANFSLSKPSAAMTHVLIGQSITINTFHRLTKVYVTDPAVLETYTANPTQLLVTARLPGVSSVVVWDDNGSSHVYAISADVNVAGLDSALKRALPMEKVTVGADEGVVTLSGNVSTRLVADAAVKLAGLYSKQVSDALVVNSAGIRQVRLRVRIVEVDRTKLEQFGFNFFSNGGNNLASTTTTQFPSTLSTGSSGSTNSNTVGGKTLSISNALNFLFYSSKLNVGATIQDLESRQMLHILAEPTITTLSGEKGSFLAGGEFPFPVVEGTTGGLASVTVEFRPYGVKLDFTPVVNSDNTIQLTVAPEVSSLDYTNAVQISGYTIPALSTRRAETKVVLQNEQSFAISGLLDQRTTDAYSRTPGISSVPILGQLFKSKNLNHSRTELIVIVTPEIVDPLSVITQTPIPEPSTTVKPLDPDEFDSTFPVPSTKH